MKELNSKAEFPLSTPEEGYDVLISLMKKNIADTDFPNIRKAYETAEAAHADQKRLSGEPYIIHPLSVAIILAELGMDEASVIAALLHDTVEDTSVTHEQLQSEFGETVADLVEGVTKIGKVSITSKEEQMPLSLSAFSEIMTATA